MVCAFINTPLLNTTGVRHPKVQNRSKAGAPATQSSDSLKAWCTRPTQPSRQRCHSERSEESLQTGGPDVADGFEVRGPALPPFEGWGFWRASIS
jgi:hypothetical protein